MVQDVNPLQLPRWHQRTHFNEHTRVLLRFFPSGICVEFPVGSAVILGRDNNATSKSFIDLTRFEAHKNGVSRRHCMLRRHDQQLVVADLNSTNGTFLNGEQLTPGEERIVTSGDHLSIGTLFVGVFFSAPEQQYN